MTLPTQQSRKPLAKVAYKIEGSKEIVIGLILSIVRYNISCKSIIISTTTAHKQEKVK